MNKSSFLSEFNRFLTDCVDICRLHFQKLDYYDYKYKYTIYIPLFILSIINGTSLYQIGGINVNTAMVLSLIFTFLRITILSITMAMTLKIDRSSIKYIYSFILLTEFINIPIIVLGQIPILALFVPLWFMWTLWVQIKGLMLYSQKDLKDIIRAYLNYFLILLLVTFILSAILKGTGIIDTQTLHNIELNLQNITKVSE